MKRGLRKRFLSLLLLFFLKPNMEAIRVIDDRFMAKRKIFCILAYRSEGTKEFFHSLGLILGERSGNRNRFLEKQAGKGCITIEKSRFFLILGTM